MKKNHLVLGVAWVFGIVTLCYLNRFEIVKADGQVYRVDRWSGVRQQATDKGWARDVHHQDVARSAIRAIETGAEIMSEPVHIEVHLKPSSPSDPAMSCPIHLCLSWPVRYDSTHKVIASPLADSMKSKDKQIQEIYVSLRDQGDFELGDAITSPKNFVDLSDPVRYQFEIETDAVFMPGQHETVTGCKLLLNK